MQHISAIENIPMKAFFTITMLLIITAGSIYLVKPELIQDLIGNDSKKVVRKGGKKTTRVAKSRKKSQQAPVKEEKKEEPVVVAEEPSPVPEPEPEPVAEEEESKPVAIVEDIGKVPMVLKNVGIIKGEEWADCEQVRKKTADELLKKLPKLTNAEIKKFVRKPKNRLLLAQWVVADAEIRSQEMVQKAAADRSNQLQRSRQEWETLKAAKADQADPKSAPGWNFNKCQQRVAWLEGEEKSAHSFRESVGDEAASKLMEQVGGDPEWMEQFAFSGECVRPGMAFSILKKIYKQHPDMLKNKMVRDIATATALEYAKSGWNQQDAVERANFYITAWKDDRLNTIFDTLSMWQRRIVCGCKGDNPYGSIASLTWALNNFHLPADRYSGACWRCDYRLNNIYGDSIHGPVYYAPFEGSMGDNRQAMTYHIGGVCGSLSHFGAFAALANGIPALTAGEPGHCAFVVLVDGKWQPAYTVSWERGVHWQPFRNVYVYSSLHCASDLYDPAKKDEKDISEAWRVMASVHAAGGDTEKAINCFEKAAAAQPNNWMAWREWLETLQKNPNTSASQWLAMNDSLCKHMLPAFPEMAAELLQKGLAEGMKKVVEADELRKAFLKFWQGVKEMGPERWRIEKFADAQANMLGYSKDTTRLCDFYADVLGATASNSLYSPAILNWGNTMEENFDEAGKAARMQATLKAFDTGRKGGSSERVKVLSPVILAAENNRDLNAFQSMAGMIKKTGYTNKEHKMPAIAPYPGKLASANGMIWASSTSEWDRPYEHPGVLTPEGGLFHTGKDTDAYVVVQLPRQVHMTGIVLVAQDNNTFGRLNNMKIQVSENGIDWTDVHQFGPCRERVMRSDLDGHTPLAKYVRILRPGGPDFFHLNGIYVYGRPAA